MTKHISFYKKIDLQHWINGLIKPLTKNILSNLVIVLDLNMIETAYQHRG